MSHSFIYACVHSFNIVIYFLIFGCSGALLLRWLSFGHGDQGLLKFFPKGETKESRPSTYKIFIAFTPHSMKPCHELKYRVCISDQASLSDLRSLHSRGPLGHWTRDHSRTRRSVHGHMGSC